MGALPTLCPERELIGFISKEVCVALKTLLPPSQPPARAEEIGTDWYQDQVRPDEAFP